MCSFWEKVEIVDWSFNYTCARQVVCNYSKMIDGLYSQVFKMCGILEIVLLNLRLIADVVPDQNDSFTFRCAYFYDQHL